MRIRVKKRIDEPMLMGFGGVGLLLSPFAKILSAALIAGMLATTGFSIYKVFQVKNLKIQLLEAQNESVRLTGEINMCKGAIDSQNKEILNIRVDAEADRELVNKVNDQLDTAIKIQQGEIDRLKMENAPVTCDEARDWLRDNIVIYGDNQ